MTLNAPAADVALLDLPQPYVLFLGDTTEPAYAKAAFGLRDWARERCIAEFACTGATVTTGLPFMTPSQARANGARSMVIGVANLDNGAPAGSLNASIGDVARWLELSRSRSSPTARSAR